MDRTHAKIQFKGTEILKILSHKPSHLSFHSVPPTQISFHCVLFFLLQLNGFLKNQPSRLWLTPINFSFFFFISMPSLSQAFMDIKFWQSSNDMDDLGLTMRLFLVGVYPKHQAPSLMPWEILVFPRLWVWLCRRRKVWNVLYLLWGEGKQHNALCFRNELEKWKSVDISCDE